MSIGSVFILLVGIGGRSQNPTSGLVFIVVGIIGTLFFLPCTAFLAYGAVRLGHRDRQAARAGTPIQQEVAMPLCGRKPSRNTWSVACLVSAERDGWQVSWIGEGKNEPAEFEAASLTEATDQAARAALALYAVGPRPPGADLQFAIYPWDYGRNGAIYDISGSAGKFKARGIVGSEREIAAESLEGLVAALRQEPRGDTAMLQWIRPFAGLPAEWLA